MTRPTRNLLVAGLLAVIGYVIYGFASSPPPPAWKDLRADLEQTGDTNLAAAAEAVRSAIVDAERKAFPGDELTRDAMFAVATEGREYRGLSRAVLAIRDRAEAPRARCRYALEDPDALIRRIGIELATRLGDGLPEVLPRLVELMIDKACARAATRVVRKAGRAAYPALIAVFAGHDKALRRAAAWEFFVSDQPPSFETPGDPRLADPDLQVRGIFAYLAARTDRHDAAVVEAAIAALGDMDKRTRLAGARACGLLGGAVVSAAAMLCERLADEVGAVRRYASVALAQMGKASREALVRTARTGAPRARFWSVTALGLQRPIAAEVIAVIAERLTDADRSVEQEAAARITKDIARAFGDTIESRERLGIRGLAASLLGSCGATARDSAPQIVALLDDGESLVQLVAAIALGKLGNKTPEVLTALERARDAAPTDSTALRKAIGGALKKLK